MYIFEGQLQKFNGIKAELKVSKSAFVVTVVLDDEVVLPELVVHLQHTTLQFCDHPSTVLSNCITFSKYTEAEGQVSANGGRFVSLRAGMGRGSAGQLRQNRTQCCCSWW